MSTDKLLFEPGRRVKAFATSRKGLLSYIAIAAIHLACAVVVDPRGDFPLNDDWSYARSAFRFARESRMTVDDWSAMSLIGQVLYGGILARIFGASFLLLRLSTLFVSCLLSMLTWQILQKLEIPPRSACIVLLAWIFNPIQFCLSFTFMTEIPFLLFIALATFFYCRYPQCEKPFALLACGAALGYAFLIRQTAFLYLPPLLISLRVGKGREGLIRTLSRKALPAGVMLLFVTGYSLWLWSAGGPTAATLRKIELLKHLSLEQCFSNFFGFVFYLSFMLLPVLLFSLPRLVELWRGSAGRVRISALSFWLLLASAGLTWFHTQYPAESYLPSQAYHQRMPFLLNVLYDTGLGPLTLDPTYYETPPTPTRPRLWMWVTILVAIGAVLLGLLLTLEAFKRRENVKPEINAVFRFALLAILFIGVFEILFSHTQEGGLFDRHILLAAWPALLAVAATLRGGQKPAGGVATSTASLLIVALLGYFSVTGTRDYLEWNRLRWELGRSLLARKVDPLTIAGGFEFNGWNNYDVFRARGNIGKVFHWWYDERTYLITMRPRKGYEIEDRRQYFSWLHRMPVSVYLLRKEVKN